MRDLEGITEFYGQKWPSEMADLLLEIKETVDKKRPVAGKLEQDEIDGFKERYDTIIEAGLGQNPIVKVRDGQKKGVELNKARLKTCFAA